MIAYSYKRFSFGTQKRGDSIRRQSKLITDYCTANGLTLSDQNFEDLGVSAFRSKNSSEDSGLGQFLQALKEEKLQTPCYLLVESLDRLSRDTIDTALTQFMNILQAGVTIVTLFDNRVYKKGMDVVDYLIALISMQRANEESKIKSQRIQAVWKSKQSGVNLRKSGSCPFWLTLSDCKTFYEVNEGVDTIKRIYALGASGLGSMLIARKLNEEGLKSPRGTKWSDSTVNKLLRSRTVLGEYQPHQTYNANGKKDPIPVGEPLKGYYPAVIDEELFLEVQDLLKSKRISSGRNATQSHLNVIKGVGTCIHCGQPLRLKKHPAGYYLQCSVYHLRECTKGKPFNLRFLADWLREVWLTQDYAPLTVSDTSESKELRILEDKLDSINSTLGKLLVLLDDGDDVIFSRIKEKKAEKKSIQEEIEKVKESLSPFNVTKKAMWERFTLVKVAFMDSNEDEMITARAKLSQLLNQLKGFKVGFTDESTLTFMVTNYQGVEASYGANKSTYHKHSKVKSIWNKK